MVLIHLWLLIVTGVGFGHLFLKELLSVLKIDSTTVRMSEATFCIAKAFWVKRGVI